MGRGRKSSGSKATGGREPIDWSPVNCGSSSACPRLYDEDEEAPLHCFGGSAQFDPLHVARAYALGGGESAEFPHGTKWAFECVFMMQLDHPEAALEIIRLAVCESKTEAQRAKIGCGHLESLLANHGPTIIEEVERLALAEPRFRECLGHVWRHGMPEDIWRRVLAASGRA